SVVGCFFIMLPFGIYRETLSRFSCAASQARLAQVTIGYSKSRANKVFVIKIKKEKLSFSFCRYSPIPKDMT
ncbi:hypothetical protein P4S70_01145, partial [Enterovibrio sp. Hal110]